MIWTFLRQLFCAHRPQYYRLLNGADGHRIVMTRCIRCHKRWSASTADIVGQL